MLESHPNFSGMSHLDPIDVLLAFEDYSNGLEKEFYKKLDREKVLIARKERKNRNAFKRLLLDYSKQNKIKAWTKWKDIKADIMQEDAFVNMVGQAGSTPLDLFRDVVLDLQQGLSSEKKSCISDFKNLNRDFDLNGSFEDFCKLMKTKYKEEVLRLAFEELKDKTRLRDREHVRKEEKRLRRKMDAFKSVLKRLEPSITLRMTWADVAVKVSHKEEYQDLEEEKRVAVFEAYKAKLAGKAKESEAESDEERRKRNKKKKHRRHDSPGSSEEDRSMKRNRRDEDVDRRERSSRDDRYHAKEERDDRYHARDERDDRHHTRNERDDRHHGRDERDDRYHSRDHYRGDRHGREERMDSRRDTRDRNYKDTRELKKTQKDSEEEGEIQEE
jgi:pre-mRNA-processing factor 40